MAPVPLPAAAGWRAQSGLELPENDLAANPMLAINGHGTPPLTLSHHAGHAVSAFATSGFDDAAVLVIDGMGSATADLSTDEQSAVIDSGMLGGETNSSYHAQGTALTPLEKHMIDQGRWLNGPPGASLPTTRRMRRPGMPVCRLLRVKSGYFPVGSASFLETS